MSEQDLAKLREMLCEYGLAARDKNETPAGIPARLYIADDIVSQAVPALIAEVDCLRAENAALRDFAQAVATTARGTWDDEWTSALQDEARALLAHYPPSASGGSPNASTDGAPGG